MHALMPGEPCAYWLPKDVSDEVDRHLQAQSLDGIVQSLQRATDVPVTHGDITCVLLGDLYTVFAGAQVRITGGCHTVKGGGREATLLKFSPAEAAVMDAELGRLLQQRDYASIANDQYMFLFHGETGTVQAGIEYLRTALKIPQGYESVLVHLA
jgi:hypothetical protein